MGAAERRNAIMKVLYMRRYDKIANLAMEFGVSERTIRRDIEILSLNEPIYTQCGRYGGGVYIMNGYFNNRITFTEQETNALVRILQKAEGDACCVILDTDIDTIKSMLEKYALPKA